MEDPNYDVPAEVVTEPRWLNEARRCSYVSAIGIELGYVQLGQGAGRHNWFSFVTGNPECILSGGFSDRERAKVMVEAVLDVNWSYEVACDYPDSLENQ